MEIKVTKKDMKMIWWNWFICNKQYHPHGLTIVKLKKIQNHVFMNKDIWWDLFNRHTMIDKFPWNKSSYNKDVFDHAVGNFSGFTGEITYRMGIIK